MVIRFYIVVVIVMWVIIVMLIYMLGLFRDDKYVAISDKSTSQGDSRRGLEVVGASFSDRAESCCCC